MLKIRLKRVGRKNKPFYRIVVAEARFATNGRCVEEIGHFNPRNRQDSLTIKEDRAKYWISQGAQASSVVHNLLVDQGIVFKEKVKATQTSKKKAESATDEKSGATKKQSAHSTPKENAKKQSTKTSKVSKSAKGKSVKGKSAKQSQLGQKPSDTKASEKEGPSKEKDQK